VPFKRDRDFVSEYFSENDFFNSFKNRVITGGLLPSISAAEMFETLEIILSCTFFFFFF